ncbi:glycosyl hydrolase [Sphingobacterium bovistauri]|uniref:Glycoside hydrolase n=1 Tax=Sphingobacterium bovistauri TaxID=2781959 RepID=A0ABS7Z2N5_9SPHI|nr:glycosyl hydrolase [Sphingobacterium bovistauri]MCA5003852.1 glycoside hydrolase [Sphingobacterium bovistauri]
MLKKNIFLLLLCSGLSTFQAFSQDFWPQVTKEMKPWTRWWWMGSAVDKPNLERELQLIEKAGFGGVEVTPIYGAKGFEKRYISFLSDKWMDMLKVTTDQSAKLGIGVDMNLGTGWPFGGPQVDQQFTATKLFLDEVDLKKGEKLTFPLRVSDKKQTLSNLQALRAFSSKGEEINLDQYLSAQTGEWLAPEDVKVYALFTGRTRQLVKRAAPGGEGFTLDHLGKESSQRYFDHFAGVFRGRDLNIRSFFNDSYEVYGANWTDSFLSKFAKIKGYKLEDHLLDFSGKGTDKNRESRIKSDYREVVSLILKENFLQPFTVFSNNHKALSRNQAHGSPGNLIDLYASTDIAECETFGSSSFNIPGLRRDTQDIRNVDPDPMMFKFASSATHLSGKKYTSSETFTWLTEHFKTALSQAKPEVEQLFLSGVNHVFYHGTTFTPQDVAYPGWLFYASTNFTTSNSFWDHLPGLNSYVTRVQSILQSGKADNELLIYWPIYDVWHDTKSAFKTLGVHHVDDWLHPTSFYKQSVRLQRQGYSFDFVSDAFIQKTNVLNNKLLVSAESNPYKAIYVPETKYFSLATFKKLLELANNGATIIFESLPTDVEGYQNYDARKKELLDQIALLKFKSDLDNQYTKYGKGKVYLTKDVTSALETENLFAERLARSGLKYVRRAVGEDVYYYLVNHGNKTVDQKFQLNNVRKHYSLMDPQTGKVFDLPVDDDMIRLQIPAGYAWIVLASNQKSTKNSYSYINALQEENVFDNPWKLSFIKGGPKIPKATTLNKLSYWTALNTAEVSTFSGIGAYETTISLDKKGDKSYLLQLGDVGESARVIVNGVDAGVLWANPYQVEIGDLLKTGQNTVRIEVANLMANRMRDLDKNKVKWKNYHEINFVNINYKEFDASEWKVMDSGLNGPVKLFSY